MLKVLTGEASKGYKKKNTDTEQSNITYKYAQLRSFYHDGLLQVYIYTFMYVDTKTIPMGDHFTAKK